MGQFRREHIVTVGQESGFTLSADDFNPVIGIAGIIFTETTDVQLGGTSLDLGDDYTLGTDGRSLTFLGSWIVGECITVVGDDVINEADPVGARILTRDIRTPTLTRETTRTRTLTSVLAGRTLVRQSGTSRTLNRVTSTRNLLKQTAATRALVRQVAGRILTRTEGSGLSDEQIQGILLAGINAGTIVIPGDNPSWLDTDDTVANAKTTLGIPDTFAPVDAEANVNADWDATSGDAEILNKPGLATQATAGFFSSDDKRKLDQITDATHANVQSDWNETDTNSAAFIRGKPTNLIYDQDLAMARATLGIVDTIIDGQDLATARATLGIQDTVIGGQDLATAQATLSINPNAEQNLTADETITDINNNGTSRIIQARLPVATSETAPNADDEVAGIMSAEDKRKLDGIEPLADVNRTADETIGNINNNGTTQINRDRVNLTGFVADPPTPLSGAALPVYDAAMHLGQVFQIFTPMGTPINNNSARVPTGDWGISEWQYNADTRRLILHTNVPAATGLEVTGNGDAGMRISINGTEDTLVINQTPGDNFGTNADNNVTLTFDLNDRPTAVLHDELTAQMGDAILEWNNSPGRLRTVGTGLTTDNANPAQGGTAYNLQINLYEDANIPAVAGNLFFGAPSGWIQIGTP